MNALICQTLKCAELQGEGHAPAPSAPKPGAFVRIVSPLSACRRHVAQGRARCIQKVPGLFGWLGSSPKKRMVEKILYLDRDQPGGCVGQINILYFDAYPKYQQHQETNTTQSQYSHYRGKKVLQSRV